MADAAPGLSAGDNGERYFYAWRDNGLWSTINHLLLMAVRLAAGREASPSAGAIDSQSVKTTESGGPCGYDVGKKIKGRKRHILTDTLGLLVAAVVHIGKRARDCLRGDHEHAQKAADEGTFGDDLEMSRRLGEGVDPLDPSGDKATFDRLFGQNDARPSSKAASDGSGEIPFEVNPRADKGEVAGTDGRLGGGIEASIGPCVIGYRRDGDSACRL